MTSETIIKMRRRGGARPPGDDWSDEEVARLRDYLKRGSGLVDIAHALARTPENVAAKLADFHPVSIREAERESETETPQSGS
jgi:hypothetical protein